ncbi:MAG: tetratricopeptide repeat protein [Bacteroidales bacterium]|nr:tetratricopeptide repeat protein [Bacteroidales bacterium]
MKTRFISILLVFAIMAGLSVTTKVSAQDGNKYGKTPEDSLECIMNLSLYTEFFKQWKNSGYKNTSVNDAYGPWQKVLRTCPGARLGTYVDGVKMLEYYIKREKDKAVKNAYIDTLMKVYDMRIKYFDKEGFVLGRKGVSLYSLRITDYEKAYEILKRSVELDGNDSYPDVLVFFMRATKKMIEEGKADESIIFDNYDISNKIIEHNLEKNKGDERKLANWENVRGNIDLIFEPFATCEAIVKIYTPKFKENPDDIKMLSKLTKLLDRKKCTDDQLYFDATVKLYDLDPSPESAYLIGKMLMKNQKYSKAIDYLKEGENLEDSDDRADAYLYIAECYRSLNNYSSARNYALKSAEERPTDGNPYIIIGDMYAASSKTCGSTDLEKKAVYWVAVDKYYKAKQVDPSVADIANDRIRSYSIYFPPKEDIFFNNLNEGDEYVVECWINEKTTVRAAK